MLNNRIVTGNSIKLLQDFDDESIDLVLTDPPYAINYRSNRRTKLPKFDFIAGDVPGDWIELFAALAFKVLKNNRHLYCFCRHDTYPRFYTAFEAAGFKMKRTLIWIKNNHGSGDLKGDYAPKDEWIIFAHKGRRTLRGTRNDNVIENIRRNNKIHSSDLLHPTQKPVELLEFLVQNSTDKGETVLDPFAGVLSTAVAASTQGRRFICIDLDHDFINKGIERLNDVSDEILNYTEIDTLI